MATNTKGNYVNGKLVFKCCPIRYEHTALGRTSSTYPIEVDVYIPDEDARFWFFNMLEVNDFEQQLIDEQNVSDNNYVGAVLGRIGRNKRNRLKNGK